MIVKLAFVLFTCSWLTDSYLRIPHRSTTWRSLTRYFDASEDGSTTFIDDGKKGGALQPSMTDIRAASAIASAGTPNRPSNEGVNILSVTSLGFLKNIEEYGKARMARKAVGILSKMQAYGEMPVQEHYTAAVCACQQSDQFEQCISVFQEMKAQRINPTVETYNHLISCAEKTGHWQAALALFDEMVHEFGLVGSTSIYVSCMWAAEQGGRHDISLDLLTDMEQRGVPRDLATYAACAYSCEKAGQGTVALHVMDLMRQEGKEVDTPVYKAVIWACVKAGMWQKALELFDGMETEGALKDEECFHGAIWACTNGGLWERAVDLLKQMKSKHSLPRNTIAYDGALTALQQAGQWEACVDMLSWMDREYPVTPPSSTTYQVIIQALHDHSQREDLITEMYLRAMRDNFFVPWVQGTRLCDFRGFTLPIAKVALKTVLQSMRDGKLGLFNLHLAYVDAVVPEEWNSEHLNPNYQAEHPSGADTGPAKEPSFDLTQLEAYIYSLPPQGLLHLSRMVVDGTERVVLSRDSLAAWTTSSPFDG